MPAVVRGPERCETCGFDAAEWNDEDTINTIARAQKLIALWTEPLDAGTRNTRPEPGMWSAGEYVDHIREVLGGARSIVEVALDRPGTEMKDARLRTHRPEHAPPAEQRVIDYDDVIGTVGIEADALRSAVSGLDPAEMQRGVLVDGELHTIEWASRHAVHELMHDLTDIAGVATALGFGVTEQSGTVDTVSLSDGGVPKRQVHEATVTRRGLVGDRQATRAHHGRPWQALCLWSSEVIDGLAGEGHPIHAGDGGENITIAGLDWSALHAGAVLSISDVVCQLSAPATPCAAIGQWFGDRDFRRVDHERHPGSSRWFASVLATGTVAVGDPVRLGRARRHS